MRDTEFTGTATDFYEAPSGVAKMVNLAVALERPLLVEGEAGCGKTKLANAIAAEKKLDLVKISVKSTSQARDLLWRMDALRRLHDAQDIENKKARKIYPYLSLGDLGGAINREDPCVVLLDEIDKADIDFPNDLLDVLDTFEFQVSDLPESEKGFGREVTSSANSRPIVIITSNREKRLPEAFLRRCLYVRLHFPTDVEVLSRIVRKNIRLTKKEFGERLMTAAVKRFIAVRDTAIRSDAQKAPSTSELIDWVRILHWRGDSVEDIAKQKLPPHWETLFKTYHDLDTMKATLGADD
jgi:MoxR-like ATPase